MDALRVFWTGVRDGWDSPYDLGSGLTFEDSPTLNEVYDQGVNVGHAVGRVIRHVGRRVWKRAECAQGVRRSIQVVTAPARR